MVRGERDRPQRDLKSRCCHLSVALTKVRATPESANSLLSRVLIRLRKAGLAPHGENCGTKSSKSTPLQRRVMQTFGSSAGEQLPAFRRPSIIVLTRMTDPFSSPVFRWTWENDEGRLRTSLLVVIRSTQRSPGWTPRSTVWLGKTRPCLQRGDACSPSQFRPPVRSWSVIAPGGADLPGSGEKAEARRRRSKGATLAVLAGGSDVRESTISRL